VFEGWVGVLGLWIDAEDRRKLFLHLAPSQAGCPPTGHLVVRPDRSRLLFTPEWVRSRAGNACISRGIKLRGLTPEQPAPPVRVYFARELG